MDSYGITHILNLDADVENKFEDDYNYKNIRVNDKPDFELDKILEDCYEFIDDGRHYGNVLIHCSGTIGLSRSTAICIAYLMSKEKQKFDVAFNNVKEARSFVKPNEGFLKQLKDYEVKLRGAQEVKDSGIDDPFALRKKQEIEQEKAMVAGAASVKNRMKMFGATLDTNSAGPRSKSVSPSPVKPQTAAANSNNSPAASKWSSQNTKSMTPEPRKDWKSSREPASDWRSSSNLTGPPAPPPPPPPMGDLRTAGSDSSAVNSSARTSSALPPPPPPPPPTGDLIGDRKKPESQEPDSGSQGSVEKQRLVFGRVPPPPMKIKGGMSIEKHDSLGDRNANKTTTTTSPQ